MMNFSRLFTPLVVATLLIQLPSASAASYANPVLHQVAIDHDMLTATLSWSSMPTADGDEIDDYAYTLDGMNYVSLFGNYSSTTESESQTTTVYFPTRANAVTQLFAIAKVRNNLVHGVSNIIRAKISEFPIPVTVQYKDFNSSRIVYEITNYNGTAVEKGFIRYKVTQVKLSPGSKVSISMTDRLIYITNFKENEKIAFRVVKYVLYCNGFTSYLSCPYDSRVETKVVWPLASKPTN